MGHEHKKITFIKGTDDFDALARLWTTLCHLKLNPATIIVYESHNWYQEDE